MAARGTVTNATVSSARGGRGKEIDELSGAVLGAMDPDRGLVLASESVTSTVPAQPPYSPSTALAQPQHSPSTAPAQPQHSPSTAPAQPQHSPSTSTAGVQPTRPRHPRCATTWSSTSSPSSSSSSSPSHTTRWPAELPRAQRSPLSLTRSVFFCLWGALSRARSLSAPNSLSFSRGRRLSLTLCMLHLCSGCAMRTRPWRGCTQRPRWRAASRCCCWLPPRTLLRTSLALVPVPVSRPTSNRGGRMGLRWWRPF